MLPACVIGVAVGGPYAQLSPGIARVALRGDPAVHGGNPGLTAAAGSTRRGAVRGPAAVSDVSPRHGSSAWPSTAWKAPPTFRW